MIVRGVMSDSTVHEIVSLCDACRLQPGTNTARMQLPLIGKFGFRRYRSGSVKFVNEINLSLTAREEIRTQARLGRFEVDVEVGALFQISAYGSGDRFFWHRDNTPLSRDSRIAALSVQLSNEGDYRGGELQTWTITRGFETHSRAKGTYVLIPGRTWHRVKNIQQGTRRSAVFWVLPASATAAMS